MWARVRSEWWRSAAVSAGCAALAMAYFGAVLLYQPQVYDEGLIVCGAERVAHHQVPYRDFFTGYPPGQFYTVAAVFRAFDASLLAERIWDSLWRLAIVGLACLLAQRVAGGRAHALPLVCLAILTGALDYQLYPMISGTLFAVGALACAAAYLRGQGSRWLCLSGLAAGAGILYRHDLLLCICGAVMAAIAHRGVVERQGRWFAAPGVFLGSVIVVVAPVGLLLWSAVPLDVLKQAFVEFPLANAAARRLPFAAPSIPELGNFYLPLAMVALSAVRWRATPAAQRPVLLLCILSAGLPLALATQRLDLVHAYPAILFSLVLLSWELADSTRSAELARPSWWRGAMVGTACLVVLYYGLAPLDVWSRKVASILRTQPSGIARAGAVRLRADQAEAVLYIQRHLTPGEPLYAGTATHRSAYFNDAMFYFLAERPQATRFDMFLAGVTNTADGQAEIARDLEAKRVEYVVLFAAPVSHEPNASSADSGITLLDDAIAREYAEVARFGRYTIRRRLR